MVRPSFDLLTEGFCPVRWAPGRKPPDGRRPEDPISLPELFLHAHDIADIQVSPPPAAAGLLRVLIVLLARMTKLNEISDLDEWSDQRDQLLQHGELDADTVSGYFTKYQKRFDLLHPEHPLLQDPRLVQQCRNSRGEQVSSGVNKLVLGRAAGQAFVWRSHTIDSDAPPVPVPEAFFALLAWLYYGPAGRCTSRQVPGQAQPVADTKAGPLRGTVSFHPWGRTLLETLLIGLPFLPATAEDLPPWEQDSLPDPMGVPLPSRGLAGVLTSRARHSVLLTPAPDGRSVVDARITWAWRAEHPPALDPFLIYRSSKDSPDVLYPVAARAERAVWRDLDALLGKVSDSRGIRRPPVFTSLESLDYEDSPVDVSQVRIRAFGFDQDRAQVKDRQYFSGTTPPLLGLVSRDDSERQARLGHAITAAEGAGQSLRNALSAAWAGISRRRLNTKTRDRGVPWLQEGMSGYWQKAEHRFWQIVLADTPPQELLRNAFIRLALRVYDDTTEGHRRSIDNIKLLEAARRLILRRWQSAPKEATSV